MTSNLQGSTHLLCSSQREVKIYELLEKTLKALDLIIVEIKIGKSGKKFIPQIMLEKSSGEAADLNDCEKAIKNISTILSVEDPFGGEDYNIEVLSTGLDRPLTRLEDFITFTGEEIKVKTSHKIDDRKNFSGILEEIKPDGKIFIIKEGNSLIAIELAKVTSVHLDKLKNFKKDPKISKKKFKA
jgi:ribosome maturation factor RimP